MTSPAVTKRNRQNAKSSTGPKTAAGKARVSSNARRHGATAQPAPSAVSAWLAVILDRQDIKPSDLIPGDERGFRAMALARAEAQLFAADVSLRDFEADAIAPDEEVPGLVSDATTMLRELSGHAGRSRDMQINTTLLRMLRWTDRENRVLARGRHTLLKRYLREARGHRKRAFQVWLQYLSHGEATKVKVA